MDLLERYETVTNEVKAELKKKRSKINKIIFELAETYGLDFDTYQGIAISDLITKKDLTLNSIDFCTITDNYDEYFNEVFPPTPFEFNTIKQAHIKAYPVSIDINKFATKNDVLDFLEKRWDEIEDYLQEYRGKKLRIRRRKLDRKITDFIWEHKNLTGKEIKKELDKEFPNNGLAYHEIGKIKSIENQRRFKKLV